MADPRVLSTPVTASHRQIFCRMQIGRFVLGEAASRILSAPLSRRRGARALPPVFVPVMGMAIAYGIDDAAAESAKERQKDKRQRDRAFHRMSPLGASCASPEYYAARTAPAPDPVGNLMWG
jgi:hypothetical protein